MHLVFVDDARQRNPTRDGMRPLVATGGVAVPLETAGQLESTLDAVCAAYGFPSGEEFKWSPDRSDWMRKNLVGDQRKAFFVEVLEQASISAVTVLVMISDTKAKPSTQGAPSPEFDTLVVLLERVHNLMWGLNSHAVVIADQPGGGRRQEKALLVNCQTVLSRGTKFVDLSRIPINVVTTGSELVRSLQLADLVTSCTTAFVAGEKEYSPDVFQRILPMVRREYDCYGGRGIKIHPDFRYANLYHWLLGDTHYVRYQWGEPMPLNRPYRLGPDEF
jgi:hypothetical protein